MRPASYPFLAISKRHGIPYENVLKVASDLKNDGAANFAELRGSAQAAIDIAYATEEQRLIREGIIDWQTGERRDQLQ